VSGDYASGTSTRIWAGLTSLTASGGNWTTMIGTDTPTSAQAALIRYSNNASDAEYQLVTCNGSACNVVAFPSGAAPSTSLVQASITINYSTSVVATLTIGGTTYTATSTSDLPSNAAAMGPHFSNTETSTTATHMEVGEIYGYDPGSVY
jgi:hypothetical protein